MSDEEYCRQYPCEQCRTFGYIYAGTWPHAHRSLCSRAFQFHIAWSLTAVSLAALNAFDISVCHSVFFSLIGAVGMTFATEIAEASGRGGEFLDPVFGLP